MFDNIPIEMKTYRQWVCWRAEEKQDGKATKVPYNPFTGGLAAVDNPDTWGSFEDCVKALNSGFFTGIGFVLTEADPFAFVDLDNPFELRADGQYKHKDPQGTFEKQKQIFEACQSYAELSPSGAGLHIICRGKLPTGRKRGGIEIYSSFRYMTMTGNVYRDLPVNDCNQPLNGLWEEMSQGVNNNLAYFGLAEEKSTDSEIMKFMFEAENGEKAYDLYCGNWFGYYSSHSEADLALINIIAFYTQNSQQIIRIFQSSALGQREKGKRVSYLGYMLNKCFDQMLPPIDITGLQNQLIAALERKKQEALKVVEVEQEAEALQASENLKGPYTLPPGLVGEIANFIYSAAARPCAEIALVGALGLMAGIVGRAYNISGTGLDQHFLALAPTGIGKDAITTGFDKLMREILKLVPAAADFIGPGEIASPQAVIKYMANGKLSFVSSVGEVGLFLQQVSDPKAPAHLAGMRRFILDIYNKSGKGISKKSSIFADKDKNTGALVSPNFCIVGDSTPESFYENLSEKIINDGLLPRFNIIEYHGRRPPLNKNHWLVKPSNELIERLGSVCSNSLMLNSQNEALPIRLSEKAEIILDQFDKYCDGQINSTDRDAKRQLWNRGHLKSLKIAGLLAVGIQPYNPIVSEEVASWAINLVTADIRNLLKRIDAGEIGTDNDELKQLQQILKVVKDYITLPWHDLKKYCDSTAAPLYSSKIIPYSYIQRRLASTAIFRKDKTGTTNALKRALKTLIDRGDLQEMSKAVLHKDYGTTAICYMIKNVDLILSA